MSAFGLAGLVKNPGAVYKVAQNGFATFDKTVSGVLTGPITFLQGDIAEEWPNTVLLSIEVVETGSQCDHREIKLHYEGKDTAFAGPLTSQNISIDFTTSQEPIESHPNFVTEIGGTPTAPLHGAFFDATTGEFIGFPVVDPMDPTTLPSRFAGLRSYLMPQQIATYDSVEYDYPSSTDIGDVGRVVDPGIPLPALPGSRSWLSSGIRVKNIANVYYLTQKVFQLSGPRNWIPEVYGSL